MQPTATTSVPATRISQAFEQARHEGQGALIPYFMCGYPTAAQSVELVLAAARGGADIIELGMPFSDPLADGATIQYAGHVALEGGMTISGCMQVASQVAARSPAPLLFMGYYNPIMAYGIERFCKSAAASGICGLIIPDLPPEEAQPLQQAAQQQGLALIFLVPPTTSDERIAEIVRAATVGYKGFLYCVSLSGVTGERAELPPQLRSFVERVRTFTRAYDLPLAVGFGLSTPEHIAAVTSYVEAAVVGSALVNLVATTPPAEQAETVRTYIASLKRG
jgi:tryptophan synthase alpha chain